MVRTPDVVIPDYKRTSAFRLPAVKCLAAVAAGAGAGGVAGHNASTVTDKGLIMKYILGLLSVLPAWNSVSEESRGSWSSFDILPSKSEMT